jgi:general secretion pathway protein G
MKINPFIPRLGILLKKPAFTLVEMLIVIVIIGILAAALIPRLTSARSRANDTARKADLQQIATAIVAYQLDAKTFPTAS